MNNDDMDAILTADEYEPMAVAALVRLGMPPEDARAYMASRWPIPDPDGVQSECRCRGLSLGLEDLVAFLASRFGRPVDPAEIGWPSYLVSDLLSWCVAEGRGEPSGGPSPAALPATVAEMFDWLRSEEQAVRTIGGAVLGMSLGAGLGLAGETREDFEYLLAPQLSELLEKAMAGDGAAVDELERIVTTDPAAAFRRRVSARSPK